jgi:hypothetical protein
MLTSFIVVLYIMLHLLTRSLFPVIYPDISIYIYQLSDRGLFDFATQCSSKWVFIEFVLLYVIVFILLHCRTLTSLKIPACMRIGAASARAIGEHCSMLVTLDMEGCNKVTTPSARMITNSLWELKKLNFSDFYQISDEAFTFDVEGDGRKAAQERMLTSVLLHCYTPHLTSSHLISSHLISSHTSLNRPADLLAANDCLICCCFWYVFPVDKFESIRL